MTGEPPSPLAWLQATGLPQAWRGHGAWRVLDTCLDDGARLVQLWQAWLQDPHACHMLHVVAFADHPDVIAGVLRKLEHNAHTSHLAQELEPQCRSPLPGWLRLVVHGGRLQLTLCVGTRLALLREQQFQADTVVVSAAASDSDNKAIGNDPVPSWDNWSLKALTRLSRRGSTLVVLQGAGLDLAGLPAAGWVAHDPATLPPTPAVLWNGHFQPTWQIKTTRQHWPMTPAPVSHCVVVGAGLAGAGVAGALALRGWRVTVLDTAPQPAAGASGLPVGLFAPQRSRDDGPRARLSRAGIHATLQAARRLLRQGQDWDPCGVAHIDASTAALPQGWIEQARVWVPAPSDRCDARDREGPAQLPAADQMAWHAAAGWIKPQQLVRAWLAQPGVRFQGNSPVQAIELTNGQWQLYGPRGDLLAEASQLVIAAAGGSEALLQQALRAARQTVASPLLPLTPVAGQVSWALHGPTDGTRFPPFPVNGAGSVVAHVPWLGGAAWFAGATYEVVTDATWSQPAQARAQAHAENLARLQQLLPEAAAMVSPAFANGAVQAWRGTRWTWPDRLPLAGAWPIRGDAPTMPGLWLSTAMGSRALTYSALCGELIAAQLGAEPLPLARALHRGIDVRRALKARERTGGRS